MAVTRRGQTIVQPAIAHGAAGNVGATALIGRRVRVTPNAGPAFDAWVRGYRVASGEATIHVELTPVSAQAGAPISPMGGFVGAGGVLFDLATTTLTPSAITSS